MPNNLDFSTISDIKQIEIFPNGWVTPLYIEYGISDEIIQYIGISCCCWRVKGTLHTFIIPISRIDYLSSGDYKKHFENALENFKEDFIDWKNEGFIYEWEREYRDQYSNFIII